MYESLYFDFAREALKYLIKTFGIKELYIPYYLCDVIRHTLVEEKCKPVFYHIDDNFMPCKNFSEDDYILYPNYFGICDRNVNALEKLYPKLIVDNAHAFYNSPQGFACFNSERKFLPVEKGSTLWIKNAELSQVNYSQKPAPPDRINQFRKFHEKYESINCLNINLEYIYSPFCYPLLASGIKEADKIVKELVQEGKIIYRYWNPMPKNYNEYKFYSRLIPIPLD